MRTKSIEKMNKIVEYINNYFESNNKSPSIRDIAESLNMSKSNTHNYIQEMIEKNMLEQDGDTWRGLRTTQMLKMDVVAMQSIPQVGYVSCGIPMLAEENIERYIPYPKWLLNSNGKYFFLKASGKSMVNAGIDDGDLVLVRQQEAAEFGQLVVALTEDGETTLKRLCFDSLRQQIVLHPENETYPDIYCDLVKIQGVAEKVIKDLI